jgi:hypothetical protein
MDDLAEVLGGVNLHSVVGCECCPDRVRARPYFAPESALDEIHRVRRRRANPRIAVEPQQQTLGIADDDQVVALVGEWPEPATNQRRGRLERMRLPTLPDVTPIPEGRGRTRPRPASRERRHDSAIGRRT